jgi:hypothetical protein
MLTSMLSVIKFKSLDLVGWNKRTNYYLFSIICSGRETFIGVAGLWLNYSYFTGSVSGALTVLVVGGWLLRGVVLARMPLAIENLKARTAVDVLCTHSPLTALRCAVCLHLFCHPLEVRHLVPILKTGLQKHLPTLVAQWGMLQYVSTLVDAVGGLALLWFIVAVCALTHAVALLTRGAGGGDVVPRDFLTRAGVAAGVMLYGQILLAEHSAMADDSGRGDPLLPAGARVAWNGAGVDVAQSLLFLMFDSLMWADWTCFIGYLIGASCYAVLWAQ